MIYSLQSLELVIKPLNSTASSIKQGGGELLVAQTVKNLAAMQETWVQSLGWEDPLEKGIAYPLQYSCLKNSMDRGVWQATVHGVTRFGHNLATKPPPHNID